MIAAEDGESGRAIAAVPLGHVLLERRSLFVLTGSAYQSHLHGIAARTADWVRAPGVEPSESARGASNGEHDDRKEGDSEEQKEAEAGEKKEAEKDEEMGEKNEAEKDAERQEQRKDEQKGENGGEEGEQPVTIANASLLGPIPKALASQPEGLKYDRETRVSLTFRHARKALKGGKFSMLGGALRRT